MGATVILLLMLRLPVDGIVHERIEMNSIDACWKAAAAFVATDVKALKAEVIGAACEIHFPKGQDS